MILEKKIKSDETKLTPVASPLTMLELFEWYTETTFKEIASETAGVKSIQRMGKKELGNYLKSFLNEYEEEIKKEEGKKRRGKFNKGMGNSSHTGRELLWMETWPEKFHIEYNCLSSILLVSINNFNIELTKIYEELMAYAYLQVGLADILHILIADHLGCDFIASFDSDFKRVKQIVKEETNIKILSSPEQVINYL